VYNIPNFGSLVFCGLEGWMHPVRQMVQSNDLGHPLAAHLREGCWAMDYVHDRVQKLVFAFDLLERLLTMP
jgi:glycogen debranching enzyme